MDLLPGSTPERFLLDFFTSFTEEIVRADTDPETTVDRYFTPDIVQISDGATLDRAKFVAHLRPARTNLIGCRYEIHEAILSGDRIAARLTMHAEFRKGRHLSTDIHLFGQLTEDGRLRRTTQLTRTLPES
ncbi:hypothetical protein Acor_34140 [Acrocarpospora corrugata]|uniref:SnoaL-like domain-containing protein n=1 Tax=Acrocarpospora corrugata TaxID=35763 RepID=A0A5M3VZH7_9ACTN|nr:nuclear transport factor 2 family protein [Acrocarpospora corrugata]GES01350.1 hypothetical protein Acor_34140 [Acrocarpospora corrugata]